MTIDDEHVFSQGHLLLSHIHSHLFAQLTRTLLCLGQWSLLGLVKDGDIKACLKLNKVAEEEELPQGWDDITTS